MDYAKVGKKMQELRLSQGITQERVASDLDCTVAFVSNVENNRAKLNLRVLLYYAGLCNVSVDTILSAGLNEKDMTPLEQQVDEDMIRVFHSFSLEEREKIVKLLKTWQES